MAIIEMVNGKKGNDGKTLSYKTLESMKRLIHYILNPVKTNDRISGGIFCNTQTAYEEFVMNKAAWGKLPESGNKNHRQVIHFVQSFDPKDKVSPELANKIAKDMLKAKQFEGFQVLYAVHTNTENIHTHFVLNTVNYETGRMWQISKQEMQALKDYSDKLCKENNLSIIKEVEKNKVHSHKSSGEYRAEQRGISWKQDIFEAAKACKKIAQTKEDFILLMDKMGYSVRWEDSRRDITFTNSNGKKINSDKLGYPKKGYTPFTKEELEKQFAMNRQIQENKYESLYVRQGGQEAYKTEVMLNGLIKLGKMSGKESKNPTNTTMQKGKLEGQALKEKLKEMEKGKGIDWERDN